MQTIEIQQAPRGIPFGIGDHGFFQTMLLNTSPYASLREALINSHDAGATVVDIYPGSGGRLVIRDNGSGMTKDELRNYLGSYGAGASQRGHQDHFGIGLKVVCGIQNPKGVRFVSWVRHGPKQAFMVVLGQIAPNQFGLMFHPGTEEVIQRVEVPKDAELSGTEVWFSGLEFSQIEVLRYISSRFLRLPLKVRVWGKFGNPSTMQEARGLLDSIAAVSQKAGKVELKHATVHWHIREDEAEIEDPTFSAQCLQLSWQNEAFQSWAIQHGGHAKLTQYGIRAGARRVLLVVEAKGSRIAAHLDRTNITGWDEVVAQSEFQEAMPPEIQQFMHAWEAKYFDVQAENAMVQGLLRGLKAGTIPGASSGGTGGNGNGNGNGKKRRRTRVETETKTRPNVSRGFPSYSFVDQHELGSDGCLYDANNNLVLINRDAPGVKSTLELANGSKRLELELRALIAADICAHISQHIRTFSEDPNADSLQVICAFPAMARYHAMFGKRLKFD